MIAAAFTVLYRLPSGWWSAGSYQSRAEADAAAAADAARTGWVHRVEVTQ